MEVAGSGAILVESVVLADKAGVTSGGRRGRSGGSDVQLLHQLLSGSLDNAVALSRSQDTRLVVGELRLEVSASSNKAIKESEVSCDIQNRIRTITLAPSCSWARE